MPPIRKSCRKWNLNKMSLPFSLSREDRVHRHRTIALTSSKCMTRALYFVWRFNFLHTFARELTNYICDVYECESKLFDGRTKRGVQLELRNLEIVIEFPPECKWSWKESLVWIRFECSMTNFIWLHMYWLKNRKNAKIEIKLMIFFRKKDKKLCNVKMHVIWHPDEIRQHMKGE